MATCVVCQIQATVYCENDKAFLCKECDNKIHSSNLVASRHTRVRVCELCSRSASTVFCKNDKAFLCDGCDAEIHLNNPLAARHHIVPVGKLAEEGNCGNGEAANAPCESFAQSEAKPSKEADAPEQASKPASPTSSEAVVPVMFNADTDLPTKEAVLKTTWGKDFDFLELDNSWLDVGFDFTDILSDAPSDVGLVPTFSGRDEDCTDDNAVPTLTSGQLSDSAAEVPSAKRAASDSLEAFAPAMKLPFTSTSSPTFATHPASFVGAPMPQMYPGAMPQLPLSQGSLPLSGVMGNNFHLPQSTLLIGSQAALNREQRVMRYREKRKNRKFEKTIRYASRKAYAEVRPRIKGRFAKKDELLSGAWADEDGVVPDMLA